jgi:hypothetical protein
VEAAIQIAELFGQHIAAGDYAAAHSLLTKDAQQTYTPDSFKRSFEEMTAYDPGPIQSVEVDPEFAFEDWPAKRSGDVAWVYVGLFGEEYVEAVLLTLAREDEEIRLREIKWGRP